ncbi:MarR family transcriptional regulator [Paenibacillus sp. D2_2]|uniref:MarR family transcriptional regulator n=1 Tax=Paenibacillus sp. D2_2 TaxID=3073092 RepID=UPI002814ACC7|nr:MarR family transcriptional regulator [Paenibacillus sp. D2_2]WMT38875.1 MarR family transcriptional regulator [Paenibacillus sp. D2_2]
MKQKQLSINRIMVLVEQIGQRIQQEDDEERKWLIQHCRDPLLCSLLPEMTVAELHVVDAIGKLEPVNGITISKHSGIPKGTVSKITRRLIHKKLLQSESLLNNKKEILFRMTPLGEKLFILHQQLHIEIEKGATAFLNRYSEEELSLLSRILQDTLTTSWVTLDEE